MWFLWVWLDIDTQLFKNTIFDEEGILLNVPTVRRRGESGSIQVRGFFCLPAFCVFNWLE